MEEAKEIRKLTALEIRQKDFYLTRISYVG